MPAPCHFFPFLAIYLALASVINFPTAFGEENRCKMREGSRECVAPSAALRDPSSLKSWVPYAEDCPFPIQNLPFGVFSTEGKEPRCGSAIGEYVIDLSKLESVLPEETKGVFNSGELNGFMSMGNKIWSKTRLALQTFFSKANESAPLAAKDKQTQYLIKMIDVTMHVPARIGDYTDFYSSRNHAENVGIMFRGKENALKPNWLHLPVGYHGRASSIVISGTDIRRPRGQILQDNKMPPAFKRSERMDFELEMAFFVGPGNKLGDPISIEEAHDNIFGLVLMNDWSARDIQKWEYVPLGPFLAKNLGTTISPWIVTMDALNPFRTPNEPQEPTPLPYLQDPKLSAYDIKLQVGITGSDSKQESIVSNSNAKYLYWSFTQQLAHHSISGCNMRPGDLLGSGTISGKQADEFGSMLELSWNGKKPLKLSSGGSRNFLNDGDTVRISGYAQGEGYRIGFGDCIGTVLPAHK